MIIGNISDATKWGSEKSKKVKACKTKCKQLMYFLLSPTFKCESLPSWSVVQEINYTLVPKFLGK